jgi:glutathione S-transferase
MDWNSTTFIPAMRDAFWQLIRTPEPQRDLAAIEKSRTDSEKGAAILEAHLAKHRYMTDSGFTAADIVIGCAVHRWLLLPVQREPRPNLQRWYDEIRSRRGAKQVTSLALS